MCRIPIFEGRRATWNDAEQITFEQSIRSFDISSDEKRPPVQLRSSGETGLVVAVARARNSPGRGLNDPTPDVEPRFSPDGSWIGSSKSKRPNERSWFPPLMNSAPIGLIWGNRICCGHPSAKTVEQVKPWLHHRQYSRSWIAFPRQLTTTGCSDEEIQAVKLGLKYKGNLAELASLEASTSTPARRSRLGWSPSPSSSTSLTPWEQGDKPSSHSGNHGPHHRTQLAPVRRALGPLSRSL